MNSSEDIVEIVGDGSFEIGARTKIGAGVQVIFHRPANVRIGDYCTIGDGVKFVVNGGDIALGDWTTVHDRSLLLSTAGLSIGQHGWFGQHCVLDGSGGLTIRDGVRVGMYSQIWTHVAAGEQIEGCTLFGVRPTIIDDDVWLVGSCIVSSGVTLGRRTVALIGSNITKSWPSGSVLAGSPSVVKPGLSFYKNISDEERWNLLKVWVEEIASSLGLSFSAGDELIAVGEGDLGGTVLFVRYESRISNFFSVPNVTVCCLETKRYAKALTDNEHSVLKALAGNRARFRAPLTVMKEDG
jgi:acetyltransferase-like isoleucine patch superfamily enzyme